MTWPPRGRPLHEPGAPSAWRVAAAAAVFATGLVALALAATITGNNGTFTTEVSRQSAEFPNSRDGIRIKYKADPAKVRCDTIRVIQTVLIKDQDGDVIQPQDIGDDFQQPGTTLNGTTVDYFETSKDAYYNGNDPRDDNRVIGASNGTTSSPTGLFDSPFFPKSAFLPGDTLITMFFETCAVCQDDGKILDCIRWTYTRNSKTEGRGDITDATGPHPPSNEFKDAVKMFNQLHKNGTICPEGKAEEQPIERNATPGHSKLVPPEPHPGQSSQVDWKACNASLCPISNLEWRASLDNGTSVVTLASGTFPSIGGFGTQLVSFTVPPVPAGQTHVVTFKLDPDDDLDEFDETDNQQSFSINDQGLVDVPEEGVGRDVALAVRPNPFAFGTTIDFALARPSRVRIRIYDVEGRLVRALADAALGAGRQSLRWDGLDGRGRRVRSGMFIVRVERDGAGTSARLVRIE